MPEPTEFKAAPDSLLVFLDETGHERMPKGHTYYGIGGCAVLFRDYDQLVARPWRAFRQFVIGNADAHLHAFEFGRDATTEQLEAFGAFFRSNHFMRLGSIGAITTTIPEGDSYKETMKEIHGEEHLAWMVLRALPNRILDVAKWTPFRSVALIFEQNPRSKRLLQKVFGDFGLEENGQPIPVELFEMSKAAGEPGLEVADFVANTIAGHGRWLLVEGRSGFRRDFQAVFQSVGSKLSSFMAISSVAFTPSAPQPPAASS
jgi:Protein of unknown function (DUF3800)